jgi:cytochrome P450
MTMTAWYAGEDVDLSAFDPNKFDAHDPAFIRNPYPFYRWFRDNRPVHWVDTPYKSFWVFAYDDVAKMLGNDSLWVKNDPAAPAPDTFRVSANVAQGVFSADNPNHDAMRNKLEPLFRQAISDAAPRAKQVASDIIFRLGTRRRVELIDAFALPLPLEVLRQVLGVERRDWPLVTKWVDAFAASNDPTNPASVRVAGATSAFAMRAFYDALSKAHPIAPVQGGLLDSMLRMKAAPLSDQEIVANAVTLTIAGYLSTTFLIGTGLLNLLRLESAQAGAFDTLRQRLPQDPIAMESAIWEMLRFDPPFQLVDRLAAETTSISGQTVLKGQTVTAVVGSANRDAGQFPVDTDRFDVTRFAAPGSYTKVLTFGGGIHRCLGEPLARQVLPVAFTALLTQFPPMRLAGQPQWQTDPFLRAVSNLPVEFVS